MVINKYKKISDSFYRVYFDEDFIDVHEDLILKYELLIKKEIDNGLLNKLKSENDKFLAYNKALKYLKTKMRSVKEIKDYLKDNEFNTININESIDILLKQGYLNDNNYCKSFINDKISLSNDGIKKIIKSLIDKGIDKEIVYNNIIIYTEEIECSRIQKLINKYIKNNKNKSSKILKQKITSELIALGYNISNINKYIYLVNDMDDADIYKKEYDKLYNKLKNKYNGSELEFIIKQKMYQKGFCVKAD